MRIHIEKLSRKQIQTAKGTATKIGVRFNNVWYGCFAGQWNQSWKEGDTIEAEVVQNGQWWNILPPKDAQSPRVDWAKEFQKINEKLDRLLGVKAAPAKKAELPPPPSDADMPPDQEEIDQQAEDMF